MALQEVSVGEHSERQTSRSWIKTENGSEPPSILRIDIYELCMGGKYKA